MVSSVYARLWDLIEEFWVALNRGNTLHLKYVAGRIVLLVGEVALLRFAVHLLERAVSWCFFFLLGALADCAWHVAALNHSLCARGITAAAEGRQRHE